MTACEPYDAERHLALGTIDSAECLAQLEYDWYTEDDSHTAALYAARAIFPYILTGNLRSANKAHLVFTSRLSASNKALGVQEVSGSSSDLQSTPRSRSSTSSGYSSWQYSEAVRICSGR